MYFFYDNEEDGNLFIPKPNLFGMRWAVINKFPFLKTSQKVVFERKQPHHIRESGCFLRFT